MKNKILILLLGVFLLSFASAQLTYQINTEVNLSIVCLNDGYCDSSSYCNINIEDPNKDMIMQNQNMTHYGTWFGQNITFLESGTYLVSGYCKDGTEYKEVDYYIIANEYGRESIKFMGYALFYIVLIILSYILVWKFATNEGRGLKDYNFFFWAGFIDLVIFVLIELNGLAGANTLITQVIKMIAFGSGAYFLIQGMYYAVSWKKKNYR